MVAHYSNAGDCRGLVCDKVRDLEAPDAVLQIQQTIDLNAKSRSEQERLKLEHPNETMLVVSGRLFGKLMSTRGNSPSASLHLRNPPSVRIRRRLLQTPPRDQQLAAQEIRGCSVCARQGKG
jgi:hypothetical protein